MPQMVKQAGKKGAGSQSCFSEPETAALKQQRALQHTQ